MAKDIKFDGQKKGLIDEYDTTKKLGVITFADESVSFYGLDAVFELEVSEFRKGT